MLVYPNTGLVVLVEVGLDYGQLSVLFGLFPFLDHVGTIHKDLLGVALLVVVQN